LRYIVRGAVLSLEVIQPVLLCCLLSGCYRRTVVKTTPAANATVDVAFAAPRTLYVDLLEQPRQIANITAVRGVVGGARGDSLLLVVSRLRTTAGSQWMPTGTVVRIPITDPDVSVGVVTSRPVMTAALAVTLVVFSLPLVAIIGGYSPSLGP